VDRRGDSGVHPYQTNTWAYSSEAREDESPEFS
jgi:hypothetical protein